jgi:hypothetical protein
MATTFVTLYTAALRAAQASASDTEAVTVAKAGINEAYLSTCGDGTDWDFLQYEGQWTTQAGADTYTYASILSATGITGGTIKEVIYLVDDTNGGRPIPSMSWGQLEGLAGTTDYHSDNGFGGPPEAWAKWNTRLRLFPEPDAVYNIGCSLTLVPTALSADGDAVLMPDTFALSVLVPYAASIVLEAEGGSEALSAANRLLSRYESNYRKMVISHGSAKRPTFNVVAPAAWADLDDGVYHDRGGW